jgi:hypothetical protein
MMTAKIVKLSTANAPQRAEWPADIGQMRPMHALLLAYDASPNDLYGVLGRLVGDYGHKDKALAMAWRNLLQHGYLACEMVAAVGEMAHNGQQMVYVITGAGRNRLARFDLVKVAAAAAATNQTSLF